LLLLYRHEPASLGFTSSWTVYRERQGIAYVW